MTGNLKIIAKYGTPEEAHLIRNRLEAAGIPAFLDGEMSAGWAWHFANAMGGVKVLVPEEHAEAAEAILAARDGGRTTDAVAEGTGRASARTGLAEEEVSPSWRCANCGAQVDSAMDVCWACGTLREEEEAEEELFAWKPEEEPASQAEPEEPDPPSPGVAFLLVLFPPTLAFFLFTKLCEFLAPWVPDVRHHPSPEGPEGLRPEHAGDPLAFDEPDLDDLVLRAWRAALIGFFLMPPVVMTVYSFRLLLQYWTRRHHAHRRRDRCARWTLVVNLVAALCLGFLIYLAMGGFSRSTYDGLPDAPGVMGPNEEKREP